MAIWFVFLFTVLLAVCVCDVVLPRRMWGLFKSWRFKNPDVVEPSDLVVLWYRVSGVLGAVLIVSLGVYGTMAYLRHARCEEFLPELKARYATGGVAAVQKRAHNLGLEVEDETESLTGSTRVGRIVVTEDGKPFATLWASTQEAYCNA